MSSTIKGTLEYVLDKTVCGWIQWPESKSGELRILCHEQANTILRKKVTREALNSNQLVQHFEIELAHPVQLTEILSNTLQVIAVTDTGEDFSIPPWGVLRLAAQVHQLNQSQRRALNVWIDLLDGQNQKPENPHTNYLPIQGGALSGFGSTSADKDVIIGRNGYLFLGEGSNRVLSLYSSPPGNNPQRWATLFTRRAERLSAITTIYLQLIIPEKSTALHWLCPFSAEDGSPIFRETVECAKKISLTNFCLVPIDFGANQWEACDAFQLRDSHLSTLGACKVAHAILDALNLKLNTPQCIYESVLLQGDLGNRFPGDQREVVKLIKQVKFGDRLSSPQLVKQIDPDHGHRGIKRVWHNAGAPFEMKVVAMANSFFERGVASTQISWWCSHLFTEFHFCWTSEFDEEYIDRVKPDVVIGQTIERFLRIVPEH